MKILEKVDFYDVVMVIYNFLDRRAEHLIRLAHQRNLGTMVMKAFGMPSGSLGQIDPSDEPLEGLITKGGKSVWQAALRWTLSNANISTVVPGMHSIEEIKEDLAAVR